MAFPSPYDAAALRNKVQLAHHDQVAMMAFLVGLTTFDTTGCICYIGDMHYFNHPVAKALLSGLTNGIGLGKQLAGP